MKKLRIGSVLAVAVALSALGVSAYAAARPDVTAPQKITVNMSEFKFVLSKKTVKRGKPVVFTVVNKGTVGHDFKIGGKKTRTIAPGKRTTLRVTFPTVGRKSYLCTLPSHAPAGMKGALVVVR